MFLFLRNREQKKWREKICIKCYRERERERLCECVLKEGVNEAVRLSFFFFFFLNLCYYSAFFFFFFFVKIRYHWKLLRLTRPSWVVLLCDPLLKTFSLNMLCEKILSLNHIKIGLILYTNFIFHTSQWFLDIKFLRKV